MNYTTTFGKLCKWALGQRAIHDLVVHPLMALTGYSDASVKFHDFHAFQALQPNEEGLVGITGRQEDVERFLARAGLTTKDFKHCHTDGLMCWGNVEETPSPRGKCKTCEGTGWVRYRISRYLPPRAARCPDCRGTGKARA